MAVVRKIDWPKTGGLTRAEVGILVGVALSARLKNGCALIVSMDGRFSGLVCSIRHIRSFAASDTET